MKCLLCGSSGIALATSFHCSNQACPNHENEGGKIEVPRFPYAPLVKAGDRIKVRQYDCREDMDDEEAEYLKRNPDIYESLVRTYSDFPKCVRENNGWLTVKFVFRWYGMPPWNPTVPVSERASRVFAVVEYASVPDAAWTSVWVEEVKRPKG